MIEQNLRWRKMKKCHSVTLVSVFWLVPCSCIQKARAAARDISTDFSPLLCLVNSRGDTVSNSRQPENNLEIKFLYDFFTELATWLLPGNWLGSTRAQAVSLQSNLMGMISLVPLLAVTSCPSGWLCSVWLTSSLSLCARVHS